MKKDFFTIIQEGDHKGKRLYFEEKCGGDTIVQIEILYLFQDALKNNYKIFLLNCKPNHNIIIPENDLNFIKTSIKREDQDIYKNHIFSEEVLNLKQLQYEDLLKLYNLAIKNNNIGALFLYPFLNNNFYCFNIFLIVNQEFDLNSIINNQYNVIKVNSVTQYYEGTITLDIIENIYDFSNLQFKDYIITHEEIEKTTPYNVFDLPEKIEYNNFLESFNQYIDDNPGKDFSEFYKKSNFLRDKL